MGHASLARSVARRARLDCTTTRPGLQFNPSAIRGLRHVPIGDDTDLLGWLWSTRFNNALGPHTIVNANLDDLSAIDSCSAAIGCALGYWASAD